MRCEAMLAAAVIRQAIADARAGAPAERARARVFLAGSPAVWFWCDVAGLNAATVRRLAEASVRAPRRIPPSRAIFGRRGSRARPQAPGGE
jgi:hypothetical protein